MRLDVVLDLLLELLGADRSLRKNDARLDNLAANRVRSSAYAALENVRKLHDDALDLERSDAVAGGFDDVVLAADIPVEAVLILPCNVAGVVDAVMPSLLGEVLTAVVAEVETARNVGFGVDADLAVLADRHGLSVVVKDVDMVLRRGLAHGAELVLLAVEVTDDERRLGLAEAFHDAETGIFLEYFINLGVERLACGGRMDNRGEVVFADVLLDQHAVHGGRCAKCRDMVLCEHRKDVLRVEAVEIVHEDRRLAQPLAVELAPQSLAPAGV